MLSLIFSSPVPAVALACLGCGSFAAAQLGGHPIASRIDAPVPRMQPTPARVGTVVQPTRWTRAPDGLFYVNMQVNGMSVRFLVDTGASVTVLTPEDAGRVGAPKGEVSTMSTVGGDTAMYWSEMRHIALGASTITHVPVAVVDGSRVVSLLGQDLLRQMGSVSIRHDEMTIG